ncbi:hypothetical protein, partial [Pseudoflavonifractor sp. 60]|uniref:hypothetical protein n=1 Tax=Pseudoflavonifractor sp. 60 TaxID=2304576 RepID=UPI001A9BE5FD
TLLTPPFSFLLHFIDNLPSAKRWGLISRHYFDLKSEVEDSASRDNPPTPFAKGGKRLRRLCAPAVSQGGTTPTRSTNFLYFTKRIA